MLLIGQDLAEIYQPDNQKMQILSIYMNSKDQQAQQQEDVEFRNYVNQFILNMADQCQVENDNQSNIA